MHLPTRQLATLLLAAATLTTVAQQPRTTILIDPAHGGPDTGARLASSLEKDETLAFALRLRAALAAAGYTVLLTRDADPAQPILSDQRAELANQRRPTAAIILHLAASGTGVHIITSALPPADELADPHIIPWDTAQATALPASLRLANQIGLALQRQNLPVTLARASLRPLDNVTCPAIAIELAPLADPATDPSDPAYQQRVAQAILSGLAAWRTRELHAATSTGTSETPAGTSTEPAGISTKTGMVGAVSKPGTAPAKFPLTSAPSAKVIPKAAPAAAPGATSPKPAANSPKPAPTKPVPPGPANKPTSQPPEAQP